MTKRKLIGTVNGAIARQRVYRIDNGLEIDDIDNFEITRRRVFFEDVVAMTWHHETGWLFISILAFIGLSFMAGAIATYDIFPSMISFAILATLFLVPAIARLFLGVEVITVHGRRTRARMKFAYRKRHAQRVFEELRTAIQSAQ